MRTELTHDQPPTEIIVIPRLRDLDPFGEDPRLVAAFHSSGSDPREPERRVTFNSSI